MAEDERVEVEVVLKQRGRADREVKVELPVEAAERLEMGGDDGFED